MNQEKHHIFIIAGETSGDMHGAELVKSIKEKRNEINISGIGGELLKNSGVELLYIITRLTSLAFLLLSKIILILRIFYFIQLNTLEK